MQYLPIKNFDNSIEKSQNVSYIVIPEVETQQEGNLKDYISAIRNRKFLVILPSIVCFPLIFLYVISQSPVYEATATVHIEKENPNIISIDEVLHSDASLDFYTTQYELIKSRSVISQVVDELQLDKQETKEESFINQQIKNAKQLIKGTMKTVVSWIKSDDSANNANLVIDPVIAEKERYQKIVMNLQEEVSVEPRKGTRLVDIKLRADNPKNAVEQVNLVAQTYVRQNLENKLDASRKAISWLQKRSQDLSERIDNTEGNIQDYKTRKQIIAVDQSNKTYDVALKEIDRLQESYVDINTQKNDLQAEIEDLNRISLRDIDVVLASSSKFLNNTAISSLKKEYIDLDIEYLTLSKQYRSRHPKLVAIRSQMQNLKRAIYNQIQDLIRSLKKDYATLVEKEKNNEELLKRRTADLINMGDNIVQYNKLNHNLEIDKELYRTVSKRLAETTLIEALETNNIKVVELAEFGVPAAFGKAKSLVVGLIVTFGFGIALAIFRSNFDSRFKSMDEAERYLGLEFLGAIPADRKTARSNPVALSGTCTPISDSFRALQTCLPESFPESGKTLLITSALPGAGKSHTAVNLAITFAQLGKSVVLMDADLRRPKLHQTLDIPVDQGLSDILKYGFEWQSVIKTTAIDNLNVIIAGRKPHNPAALLSSNTFQNLMVDLKATFDVVVIDAPIALNIPDVAILSRKTDEVLLVHNPSKESREVVLEAKRVLDRAGAKVLGLIFNNVSPKQQGQYSGYQVYYK